MTYRAAAALVALLLAAGPSSALDPDRSLGQCARQVWREELPQNTVHSILQTRDGYLWLGTYEGLLRFDGVRFRLYEAAPAGPLPGTTIWAMAEDGAGVLWLATNGGLVAYHDGHFRALGTREGLPSSLLYAVAVAHDGSLWVGSDHGLFQVRDNRVTATFSAREGLPSNAVRGVQVDGAGVVWAATDAGLARVEDGRAAAVTDGPALLRGLLRAVLVDPRGRLWVGGYGGIARREGDRFVPLTSKDGLPDDFVRSLGQDLAGNIYVGTETGGMARLRAGTEAAPHLEAFSTKQGLANDSVRAIFEDREGSLWVGTNGGLNRFMDGKLTAIGVPEGLSSDFTRAILEDREGNVWIGTDGGGLDRLAKDGAVTAFTRKDGLTHDSVRSLLEDRQGRLWVGTRGGLTVREGGRFRRYAWAAGSDPARELIRALVEDAEGTVWVGTEGGGLVSIQPGGASATLTTADGLPNNDVRALFADRAGNLWIGTRGGLGVRRDGKLRAFHTADGLPSEIVFAFHEDSAGVLWIATEGGLVRHAGDRFQSFSRPDGLCDDKAFRILEDDAGFFWLSSNKGVCRVARADLEARAAGRPGEVPSVLYGRADGMRANQVNGASQPAGWRTRDGRVWFPTVSGVVVADPGRLARNALPPPVALEEVLVEGQEVDARNGVILPPNPEHVEIHYSGLSLIAPEKVRFRYRLAGFDRGFVEAGTRRVAYYTNLPSGTYRFQVLACNNDGLWTETGASFPLTVRTPWTRQWWALALWATLAAAIGQVMLRWRTGALERSNRRLEERVGERTRELEESERRAHASELVALDANQAKSVFLSSMSHELRTPLNAIIGFSSVLRDKLPGKVSDQQLKFLNNIHTSGEHLLSLINDILDLSKIEAGRMELFPEPVELRPALEQARTLMRGVSEARGVEIEIATPPGLPLVVVDPGKLTQVLFNLLSNAVKFSPPGSTVSVRVRRVAAGDGSPLPTDGVCLEVADQGTGIEESEQEAIFEEFKQAGQPHEGTGLGLALVRRLVRLHGGDVRVASALGAGSTFSVYLPCAATPPRT